MNHQRSLFLASVVAITAIACNPKPPVQSLPLDLPPPEYEPPRRFELKPPAPAPNASSARPLVASPAASATGVKGVDVKGPAPASSAMPSPQGLPSASPAAATSPHQK